jgi:cyclopropane fatty-acyl-phospholipid synthase-like methyltransferase
MSSTSGCGRGAVLFAAAKQVGEAGSATGIDLAPGMIDRTVADIRERWLTNVRAMLMNADHLRRSRPVDPVVVVARSAGLLGTGARGAPG